jgi:osmoprotectant transport system ATP-binding protein
MGPMSAQDSSPMIELDNVSKRYGETAAVDDISFAVARGEFLALIGPSGCGKSTTLRMINRLIEHSSGRIRIGGAEIRSFREEELRRRMGYVIQSGGLFPHWTVERNIATVPTLLGWKPARIRDRVTELLALLQLDATRFRHAYPHRLSGGQQQRVGIARALAADPDVLLMDEPFSALDPITRAALQDALARIHKETGKTIVFVTHDMDEALKLATRIAVMDRGHIAQLGTPRALLDAPANAFVRDFLGHEDRGLRLLSVETVASRMRPAAGLAEDAPPIAAETDLRRALSAMLSSGRDTLAVTEEGRIVGALHLADLLHR